MYLFQESFFNNQYYKSLVSDKGYILQCNIDSNGNRVPIKVGNSDGSASQVWFLKVYYFWPIYMVIIVGKHCRFIG